MKARELLTADLLNLCKMYYYETDEIASVKDLELPDDEKAEQLAEWIYMSNRFNPV